MLKTIDNWVRGMWRIIGVPEEHISKAAWATEIFFIVVFVGALFGGGEA